MDDPYDLNRFVEAQKDVLDRVLEELRRGRKQTHWMWFVFPQIEGLGFSFMARKYALASLDEAAAYLAHPVLGPRLIACVEALLDQPDTDATRVMGRPDDLKLRSSLTLFAELQPEPFTAALDKFFGGEKDPATLARL